MSCVGSVGISPKPQQPGASSSSGLKRHTPVCLATGCTAPEDPWLKPYVAAGLRAIRNDLILEPLLISAQRRVLRFDDGKRKGSVGPAERLPVYRQPINPFSSFSASASALNSPPVAPVTTATFSPLIAIP